MHHLFIYNLFIISLTLIETSSPSLHVPHQNTLPAITTSASSPPAIVRRARQLSSRSFLNNVAVGLAHLAHERPSFLNPNIYTISLDLVNEFRPPSTNVYDFTRIRIDCEVHVWRRGRTIRGQAYIDNKPRQWGLWKNPKIGLFPSTVQRPAWSPVWS